MDIENLFNGLLMETGRPLHLTACDRVFKGYLVGFKPPEYLVIEVPRSTEIDAALTNCNTISGSFFVSGAVVRFESSTTAYLKKPAWLLFVRYPSALEKIRDLRSSNRVKCSIPCMLVTLFNLRYYSGLIIDINAGGCKCLLASISPSQVEKFTSEKKVLLEFDLTGSSGRKSLSGEVLNVKRDGAKILLGVKFNRDEDEATLKELEDYVSKVVKLLSR
ncbi:MAG: PilZ domain-containing protein [Syntrophobacteraceae bacterium]